MDREMTLTFRKAHLGDKDIVTRLCAKIWGGDDYLPRVFEDWAADQEGELTLCFAGPDLAGISKLSWLAPGEAWLEGLRKNPDLPVKGVGTALCRRYLAQLASVKNLKSIRFSTYFENQASIRLNEAIGFRRVATANLKVMDEAAMQRRAEEPIAQNPAIMVIRDPEIALPFLRASGWFGPFIHQSWRSYPWSEAFFTRRYLEPGHCLGYVVDGRLVAMGAFLVDPIKRDGTVPFFDAEEPRAAELLLETIEQQLARDGAPSASAIIPTEAARATALLDGLGWHSYEQEEDYFVYEFPLERLEEFRNG